MSMAPWLSSSPVHAEVSVTDLIAFSQKTSVGMDYLDHVCVVPAETELAGAVL